MTNPPLLSPVFTRVGGLLKYAPYDGANEFDVWDLSTEFAAITTAQTDANQALADAAAAQSTADDALAAAGVTAYPSGHTLSPYAFAAVSGGFAPPVFLNTVWLSQYCLISGLNSECQVKLPFEAGDWSIHMLGLLHSTAGDMTCYFDGVSLGFAGAYAAATSLHVFNWTVDDVTAGLHTVRLKITGHQPSSTGYTQYASQIIMRKNE